MRRTVGLVGAVVCVLVCGTVEAQVKGSPTVNIVPAEAVSGGAQWSLNGGTTWLNSGIGVALEPRIPYTITFKDIGWWIKPDNITGIMPLSSATETGTYTPAGYLFVGVKPLGAYLAGAGVWRMNGGYWQVPYMDVGRKVAAGSTVTISFRDWSGWTTPPDQTLTMSNTFNFAVGYYGTPAPMLNYQGHLAPLGSEGARQHDLYVRIWTHATSRDSGYLVWAEVLRGVQFLNGDFNVLLGNGDALIQGKHDLMVPFRHPAQYVGVAYDDSRVEAEVIPRQLLASVPSAMDGVPPGTIKAYAGPKTGIPEGWLVCDGTSYPTKDYPVLFGAIGRTWGGAAPKFKVPDLRGYFLRGADKGGNRDPDEPRRLPTGASTISGVGSTQQDATDGPATPFVISDVPAHSHTIRTSSVSGEGYGVIPGRNTGGVANMLNQANHHHSLSGGDAETRPKNAYVWWIIKY